MTSFKGENYYLFISRSVHAEKEREMNPHLQQRDCIFVVVTVWLPYMHCARGVYIQSFF